MLRDSRIVNRSVNRYNLSMTFTDLVTEKKLTYYKLSKLTGIPKTTIHDISSGKSDLLNCNGKTLLSLAGALDVSIEELLHLEKEDDLRKYPLFLQESIRSYKKAVRNNSSIVDCCADELISSINVAEIENLISKESANKLRSRI